MRLHHTAVGCACVVCWLPVACSSSDQGASSVDAGGVDASLPPPPTPLVDAGVEDASRTDGRPASRLAVACAGDPCYVAVSGRASAHLCGLLSDGGVRCWGRDSQFTAQPLPDGGATATDGALGRGHAVSAEEGATAAPVVGLSGVTQISVGENYGTCASEGDGSVYCWGRNDQGQLGRPSTEASLRVPTRVEGLPPVSSVALGTKTACAIASEDGALWCWGALESRIGLVPTGDDPVAAAPQRMTGFRPPVRELVIGTATRGVVTREDTVIALLDGDVLASIGEHPAGESSVDPTITGVFSNLPIELPGVVRVGAFGYLESSGVLSQWTPDLQRVRWDSSRLYVPAPHTVVDVNIVPAAKSLFEYVAQAGVLLSSGRLFRWGVNTGGALGYPSDVLDIAEQPRDMTHVAGDRVVTFAMTMASSCVSLVDGKVRCWGSNRYGELGRGTVDDWDHPEAEEIR